MDPTLRPGTSSRFLKRLSAVQGVFLDTMQLSMEADGSWASAGGPVLDPEVP